jgi:hypothetical protein
VLQLQDGRLVRDESAQTLDWPVLGESLKVAAQAIEDEWK